MRERIRTKGWVVVGVVAAGLLGTAAGAAAGPNDYLKIAPATHEAFLYIDVVQARSSKLYLDLKDDIFTPDIQAGLAALEQFIGLRFPDDLDVVAVSGKLSQPNQGCVYLKGRWDRQRIETIFSMNPAYTEILKPGGKIIGWLDEDKGTMSYGCFLKDDLVVVGPKAAVEACVDTVGPDPANSLADNPKFKTHLADAGSSPLAMAIALRPTILPPDLTKLPAVTKIQSGLFTLAGGADAMKVMARFETDSPQLAAQLVDIARGLIAVGQLQEQVPILAQVANNASAAQKGKAVALTVQIKTDMATNFLRQQIANKRGEQGPRPRPAAAAGAGRRIRRPEDRPSTAAPQW